MFTPLLTKGYNIYSCALPSHCNTITEDVGNIFFYCFFIFGLEIAGEKQNTNDDFCLLFYLLFFIGHCQHHVASDLPAF